MKKLGEWISAHILATFAIVAMIDIAFLFLLAWLTGCTPKPRFQNGDRTAYNPQAQEVIEIDMVRPEPSQ